MSSNCGFSPFPFLNRPELPPIDRGAYLSNTSKDVPLHSPISTTKPINNLNNIYGDFTFKQIRSFYNYVKRCGDGDLNFGITLDEFDGVFRKYNRALKQKDEEYQARQVMNTFQFLLKLKGKTAKQWCVDVDISQANKGDGKLTWIEFEAGMNKLCDDLGAAQFSKKDLYSILKYMDPNGDGDLTHHEVVDGFSRVKDMSVFKRTKIDSGPIVPYLQEFMKSTQVRIRDVYNLLDVRNSKSIKLEDLCMGLERMSKDNANEHNILYESGGSEVGSNEEFFHDRSVFISKSPCLSLSSKSKSRTTTNNVGTCHAANYSLTNNFELPVLSPSFRQSTSYQRALNKDTRVYQDWMNQFDRKLQNGFIMMSNI